MTSTITFNNTRSIADSALAERRLFRYTLERYHRAIEAGVITENDRVELIYGEIVEKMGIGKRHGDCLDKITLFFILKFGTTYTCRPQNPIVLVNNSEPEPDFAIINKETYATRTGNPEAQDVHLLVEISDATLDYDRTVKTTLYAQAGIKEYWIINLRHDQVEVHLLPNMKTGVYNTIQRFDRAATFDSPFCGELPVAELLPAPLPADK